MEEKLSKKKVKSLRSLPRRSNWTKISPPQQTLPVSPQVQRKNSTAILSVNVAHKFSSDLSVVGKRGGFLPHETHAMKEKEANW